MRAHRATTSPHPGGVRAGRSPVRPYKHLYGIMRIFLIDPRTKPLAMARTSTQALMLLSEIQRIVLTMICDNAEYMPMRAQQI